MSDRNANLNNKRRVAGGVEQRSNVKSTQPNSEKAEIKISHELKSHPRFAQTQQVQEDSQDPVEFLSAFFDSDGLKLEDVPLSSFALDDEVRDVYRAVYGVTELSVQYFGEVCDSIDDLDDEQRYKVQYDDGFIFSEGVLNQDFLWTSLSGRALSVFRFITTRFTFEVKYGGYLVKHVQYASVAPSDVILLKLASTALTRVMQSVNTVGDKTLFFLLYVKELVSVVSFVDNFYLKFVSKLSVVDFSGKKTIQASTVMNAVTPLRLLESIQSCQGLVGSHSVSRCLGAYFPTSEKALIGYVLFFQNFDKSFSFRVLGVEDLAFLGRLYHGPCVLYFDLIAPCLMTNFLQPFSSYKSKSTTLLTFNVPLPSMETARYDGMEISRQALSRWAKCAYDFEIHHLKDILSMDLDNQLFMVPFPLGFQSHIILTKSKTPFNVDFKGLVKNYKLWFDFLAYGYVLPDSSNPLFKFKLSFSALPRSHLKDDTPSIYAFAFEHDSQELAYDNKGKEKILLDDEPTSFEFGVQ